MLAALLDTQKPLTTHFGAVSCLRALGGHVVASVLLGNVSAYSKHFESVAKDGSVQTRLDAAKVEEAMVVRPIRLPPFALHMHH